MAAWKPADASCLHGCLCCALSLPQTQQTVQLSLIHQSCPGFHNQGSDWLFFLPPETTKCTRSALSLGTERVLWCFVLFVSFSVREHFFSPGRADAHPWDAASQMRALAAFLSSAHPSHICGIAHLCVSRPCLLLFHRRYDSVLKHLVLEVISFSVALLSSLSTFIFSFSTFPSTTFLD